MDLKIIIKEELMSEVGSKRAKDTDIIYNDGKVVIVVPKSFESCRSFSRNTEYCTNSESMFKHHNQKGDDLFRIFFKDGTKVRLTWMSNGDFHWGLGKIGDYKYFTRKNNIKSNNPFNFNEVDNDRQEQLVIKPKQEVFDKWSNNLLKKRGYDGVWDIKYGSKDHLMYRRKRDQLIGDNVYWWEDGHETLYQYIKKLPKEALEAMYEYHYGERRY